MICVNTPGSYQCQCNKGYQLNRDCTGDYLDNDNCKSSQVCEDINECLNWEDNKCPNNTQCVNTIGSFKCDCLPGYKDLDPAHPGKQCVDVNECESKSLNQCHKYAECINTEGSYRCVCTEGYEGDGKHCTPRKTCDFKDHECVKESKCIPCNENNKNCHKTKGRPAYYQCHCNDGYEGDGLKNGTGCVDINECERDPNICGDHAKCVNLPGRHECVCDSGYSLTQRYGKLACVNINECELRKGIDKGAHDCSDDAICHDTEGSFECICKKGFETDPQLKGHTAKGCIDRQPPKVEPEGEKNMKFTQYSSYSEKGIKILHSRNDDSKHKYHVEWDPVLQYEYLLDVGYYKRAVNYTVSVPDNTAEPIQTTYRNVEILDINECLVAKEESNKLNKQFYPLCHKLADCVNLNGSYTCQCKEGYRCKNCDGFTKEAATRNWKDEPWYNHKPVGINGGTGCIDTKPPEITLLGEENNVEIALCKCGTLVEKVRMPSEFELCEKPENGRCFKAYDENDGDLTNKVKVTHREVGNKTWEYTYTVSDAAGNNATRIRRNITVIDLDLANEVKFRKMLDDKLKYKVKLLNIRVDEHKKAALIITAILICIITTCLMVFGLFWKVWYMFMYMISPVALMSNKLGFEMGMDTYLRVRSLGAMTDIERKRRIIAQWTELYDIINGQDESDINNYNGDDSSRSVSEDEDEDEGERMIDDDDRDTHLGDSSRDSINTAEDEDEEEGEDDEEEDDEEEE